MNKQKRKEIVFGTRFLVNYLGKLKPNDIIVAINYIECELAGIKGWAKENSKKQFNQK